MTLKVSQKRVDIWLQNGEYAASTRAKKRTSTVVPISSIVAPVSLVLRHGGNVISRCALGGKYTREDGRESFGELARRAIKLIGAFNFQDVVPYLGWINILTGFNARLGETVKAFDILLDEVIEEHEQKIGDQSDKKDLDMFLGGTDNSASVMEWAMTELAKNPSVMKKAQEEARRVVGNKPKIDEADIAQMEYLKCVNNESLILHAPVLITRKSTTATKLEGYDIPAKTRVLINVWAIKRDPRLWERSEEFVPERFVNNPVDFKGHHNQIIPFGEGSRACPGIIFAMAEIDYVLANLLYWFDWNLPPGQTGKDLDLSDIFGPVIHKKVPLRLVPVIHSCSS
ncbi:Cytochrome P450, E-class, group I [Parasponia andersonii]|uniref:Cytochrome P450, E-class, group I n=1 Tax=Parasponia andersonii TaxID=3476 RepID=A0A2P5DGA5_PARAD|nr:Cytochrome P450, E-class, group I [Parasponia andersonii]